MVMWSKILQKHCSDEQLLSYADGELSHRKGHSVKRHVAVCWECRARLTELDEQAQNFARAFGKQTFPNLDRIATARSRLFEQVALCERQITLAPRVTLATVAGLLACLLMGVGTWTMWVQSGPKAEALEVLARTQVLEQQLYGSPLPVHQMIRVDIVASRSEELARSSSLEVWSDSANRRFASRMIDFDGSLKLGMWRSARGREHVFDPAVSRGIANRRPRQSTQAKSLLASLSPYGLGAKDLESGFVQWLQARRWRPISFFEDFAWFADQDGVVLTIEPALSENGKQVFRLYARRRTALLTVQAVLVVDADTYRPRLESIRFETPEQTQELILAVERTETIARARLSPAIFQPDLSFATPKLRPAAPVSALMTDRSGEETKSKTLEWPPSMGPTVAELNTAEMAVRYVLHRARACLGEPVGVVSESGGVRVRGLTRTVRRKAQLLAMLAELRAVEFVTVDIQTVDEAVAVEGARGMPLSDSAASSRADDLYRPGQTSRSFTQGALPIQDGLERYFREHRRSGETSANIHRQITELSSRGVTLSDAVLDEAWALRRLAEQYSPGRATGLTRQSRWLLEVMIQDHVAGFGEEVGALRALLNPILSSIAGENQGSTGSSELTLLSGPPADQQAVLGSAWNEAYMILFEDVEQMQNSVTGLFVGASLPVDVDTAFGDSVPVEERLMLPRKAAADLLSAFARLEDRLEVLEGQGAREFWGGDDQQLAHSDLNRVRRKGETNK